MFSKDLSAQTPCLAAMSIYNCMLIFVRFSVDSPAFNEAFSRNGLPRLPRTDGPDSPRLPPSRDRPPPTKPPSVRASQEPQTPAPVEREKGPVESVLLRDLPFTLQGLSSTNLPFADASSLKLPPTLPVPLISLLHTLAEPSLLYRSLSQFVESSEGGLVGQSLRSAIGLELRSYLGLVATLEGQIRRALAQLDESQPNQGLGKAGVTLKRCVVWTREATLGLRLMSSMVEQSKGKQVCCTRSMAKLIYMRRQEGWRADLANSLIFFVPRRPLRAHLRRATSPACHQAFLQHASSLDI